MPSCCVCKKSSNEKDSHFSRVPTNKTRRKEWFKQLQIEPTTVYLNKTLFVCHEHFELDDLNYNSNSLKTRFGIKYYYRLKPTAIPTLNLPSADKHEDEPPEKRLKMPQKGGRYRKVLRSRSPSPEAEEIKPKPESEIEFRRDNYHESFFSKLEKYRTRQKFCDIILRIISTNQLYRAHTLILSAASLFFEELLQNPKHRDSRNLVLSLPDYVDAAGLEPVLSFIYSGKISIKTSSVINIFKVAWLFKMEEVLEMCRQFCIHSNFPQQKVSVASEHVILKKSSPIAPIAPLPDDSESDLKSDSDSYKNDDSSRPPQRVTSTSSSSSLQTKPQQLILPHNVVTTSLGISTTQPKPQPLNIVLPQNIVKSSPDTNISLLRPTLLQLPVVSNSSNSVGASDISLKKPLIAPNTLLFVQPRQLTPAVNKGMEIMNAKVKESSIMPAPSKTFMKVDRNDIPVTLSTMNGIGKQENITIPKGVIDQINTLFKANNQTGKNSRVYFIKTQKPVENVNNLVNAITTKTNATVAASTTVENEPSFLPGMSLSEKIATITAANVSTASADIARQLNETEAKVDCELCTMTPKFEEDINGYRVHFFRPRLLSDKECSCKSKKNRSSVLGAMSTHCVAIVDLETEIKYSHPILYLLHARREKADITDNYSLLTADVQHGSDHWRALVNTDVRFVTIECSEVHYLFPKNYQIKPEDIERFKQTFQELSSENEVMIIDDDAMDSAQKSPKVVDKSDKNCSQVPAELKCEHCELSFAGIALKARHIYTEHLDTMFKDTDYFKYVCDQCSNFKHRSLTRVYFHKYRDHGWKLSDYIKQFRCGLCCKIECSLVRIKEHYDRVHRDCRDYVCDKCGFAFKTASVLTSHIRCVHVKNFKWKCEHCDKQLKDKSALDLHMRIHTGEKPFKCEDCDYASAFRGNLKTHMLKKHAKELQNLKTPDAYPRIYTRGRGRSRRAQPSAKEEK